MVHLVAFFFAVQDFFPADIFVPEIVEAPAPFDPKVTTTVRLTSPFFAALLVIAVMVGEPGLVAACAGETDIPRSASERNKEALFML